MGRFDTVLTELRNERTKIDAAIVAIERIDSPEAETAPGAAEGFTGNTDAGERRSVGSSPRRVTKTAPGKGARPGRTTAYKQVLRALEVALRAGAVVAALKGKVQPGAIYPILSYLKAEGLAVVDEERRYVLTARGIGEAKGTAAEV